MTSAFSRSTATRGPGRSLDEVTALAERANFRTRSLGVAFRGCTVPGTGATLHSGPRQDGARVGHPGEPGVRTVERVKAAELAHLLVQPLLEEAPADAEGRVVVLLNGLGSTKYEELFVLYSEVRPLLDAAGLRVHDSEVGELVTSLDMMGCSLTLFWLDDDLGALYDAPSMASGYRRGAPH